MRTIRAYLPKLGTAGTLQPLPESAFHHLVRVLRLSDGQPLEVFDGAGRRAEAKLCDVKKKHASVQVGENLQATPESPLHTHLGLVLSKGDRFDYALQKATELGVNRITPLFSERCDVKLLGDRLAKKQGHWQGVVVSACEQSYRDVVPTIETPMALSDWVSARNETVRLVFHTAARSPDWPTAAPPQVALLIGPEGGLTDTEVKLATAADFQCWQLGPRIMRTETAPVAALALLQARWGDY